MTAGVLLCCVLPPVAVAGGPETATNPTSLQPEDANVSTQASGRPDDNHVTQQIRAALMADASLSPVARLADVRTNADAVVLRGSVSAAEKDRIEQVASQYAGARSIASQLTVSDYKR